MDFSRARVGTVSRAGVGVFSRAGDRGRDLSRYTWYKAKAR